MRRPTNACPGYSGECGATHVCPEECKAVWAEPQEVDEFPDPGYTDDDLNDNLEQFGFDFDTGFAPIQLRTDLSLDNISALTQEDLVDG